MKVGIAGIGGIGSNVARHLVQAGVKEIKIVDFDTVEAVNLNRQFYTLGQVGQNKTTSLTQNLLAIDSSVVVLQVDKKIEPGDVVPLFADCGVVVEGFDDKELKTMLINELASTATAVVSASGIAGVNMSSIQVRKLGNCHVVGDFVSDEKDFPLFPPKVAMIAAIMAGIVLQGENMTKCNDKRVLPEGIYGILGEKFSLGRSNSEVARMMVDGGIDVVQYREKLTDKSLLEIYRECEEIRQITADAGVPFIINDYADIALMVGADGIHQGQDDLPIQAVRKIAPDMLLGCSTHAPEQARKAIEDGADYIGVGPIFSTKTKVDVCEAVGLEYLEYIVAHLDIPFVAIGGIKRDTLEQVVKRGAKTVCLVTEIIGAKNIAGRIAEIREILQQYSR